MTVDRANANQRTPEDRRSSDSSPLPLARVWHEDAHLVQFYESDAYLIEMLADFLETGLLAGETCLVFATSAHLAHLEEDMRTRKLDLTTLHAQGRYAPFDADEILAQVVVDGMPERERVTNVVGGVLLHHAQQGRPLRVFGEIVVQLWTQVFTPL